jgi:hypothetical protein
MRKQLAARRGHAHTVEHRTAVPAGGVGVLAGFIAVYLLGSLSGWPERPLAIGAALVALGVAAFRCGDARC